MDHLLLHWNHPPKDRRYGTSIRTNHLTVNQLKHHNTKSITLHQELEEPWEPWVRGLYWWVAVWHPLFSKTSIFINIVFGAPPLYAMLGQYLGTLKNLPSNIYRIYDCAKQFKCLNTGKNKNMPTRILLNWWYYDIWKSYAWKNLDSNILEPFNLQEGQLHCIGH